MKKRKIIAILIVIFGVSLTTISFYGYQLLFSPNILVDKEDAYLKIHNDATFKKLQDTLYSRGFVHDLVAFSFLAKLMDYDQNIKPGRYHIKSNMSNLEALKLLKAGVQEPVNITFHNIRKVEDLAERITRNIQLDSAEFIRELYEFAENNDKGFNRETILCMFLPNTYEVYWTVTAEDLIERMYREYEKFWTEERLEKLEVLGLNKNEVCILASIVQAEQMIHEDERPRIAGLYLNRLKIGMKLDSDPTLVYAIGDFTIKRVLNVHKEIDSPYNTYKYGGLTPGPINLPEIVSLKSVLNAEDHDYLYMVAREDFSGYHRFAKTLREHINNANRYQRRLTIEQRKARSQNSN